MTSSLKLPVFGTVRRSLVVAVCALLPAGTLSARQAIAQRPAGDTASWENVLTANDPTPVASAAGDWTSSTQRAIEDPPRRFPPTGGPRRPEPWLPPMRSKPYPRIDRDRLSCGQTLALDTALGTGLGSLAGMALFLPVLLTRGDRAASTTFKALTISGGVVGLIGGSQAPVCRPSPA